MDSNTYAEKALYGHLSEFKVKDGDKVEIGDVIGLSGNSGNSENPHLHYEIGTEKAYTGKYYILEKHERITETYYKPPVDQSVTPERHYLLNPKLFIEGIFVQNKDDR